MNVNVSIYGKRGSSQDKSSSVLTSAVSISNVSVSTQTSITSNSPRVNGLKASFCDIRGSASATCRFGGALNLYSPNIQSGCGVAYPISDKLIIEFANSTLHWSREMNEIGVELYNTLISTGDWSLEDVIIEELL